MPWDWMEVVNETKQSKLAVCFMEWNTTYSKLTAAHGFQL